MIGKFSERWCKDLFSPIARRLGLFAVNDVISPNIGLSASSSADLAFCTSQDRYQEPENIKLIFEIKMSIVSNYQYNESKTIELVSDYKEHRGNPSLLRSDSMLKAIGKAVNIRVSGVQSTNIPIIVLGNSPITESYKTKVDFLKKYGVIQGFWSLNPKPTKTDCIMQSSCGGFKTIANLNMLNSLCKELINYGMYYFSSMLSKEMIGKYIRLAEKEKNDISRAEKFLEYIRGYDEQD